MGICCGNVYGLFQSQFVSSFVTERVATLCLFQYVRWVRTEFLTSALFCKVDGYARKTISTNLKLEAN